MLTEFPFSEQSPRLLFENLSPFCKYYMFNAIYTLLRALFALCSMLYPPGMSMQAFEPLYLAYFGILVRRVNTLRVSLSTLNWAFL